VISTGKSFQIQNSEISVFRSEFRCILPEFRCFSPKNDGNCWKMMENDIFMKKIENFGGVCPNYVYIDRL